MIRTRHLACLSIIPLAAAALGCATDDGDAGPGIPAGLAVVSSDYKSVSVSLVDPAPGALARDNCLNSGSAPVGISQALSGDVVLPSAPQPDHELLLIDRGNGTLTWVDPAACEVRRQLSVSRGFAGASSNPHDVVALSATRAYVLRYQANPTPTADPGDHDDGNDILVIDPSAPTITGRIDVAAHRSAEGVSARPDRAVLASGKVFVTLSNVSDDFMTTGPGRVIVIDPTADAVIATIDLPAQKGCQGLWASLDGKTVLVACGGSYSDASLADGSAVVVIDAAASPPAVKTTLAAAVFGGRPLASAYVAAHADTVFAITTGDLSGPTPDQLWAAPMAGGVASKVGDASAGFVWSGLAVDGARGRLFLTDADATTPRLHVYDITNPKAPSRQSSFDVNPAVGLPPRDLGWY